jgi:hypothetical protein
MFKHGFDAGLAAIVVPTFTFVLKVPQLAVSPPVAVRAAPETVPVAAFAEIFPADVIVPDPVVEIFPVEVISPPVDVIPLLAVSKALAVINPPRPVVDIGPPAVESPPVPRATWSADNFIFVCEV